MTANDYAKRYNRARNERPFLTYQAMKRIHSIYREWGMTLAGIIREGDLSNGQLAFDTEADFQRALLEASAAIGDALRKEIPDLIASVAELSVAIETQFMVDAWADLGPKLTAEGLEGMFRLATERAIATSLYTPIGGQSFLSRVPNISKNFSDDVVSLVQAAIAQGRDVGKIASDINVFVKDGKAFTIQRWGEILEPQSAELLRRIKFDKVDYRALRLARTELGRALMETAKVNGLANPGGSGWWDWVRVNAIDWGCACPANAANSPYLFDDIPPYAHPNDMCYIRQRLKDGNLFRDQLKRWSNGESVPEIDAWYRTKYLPAQSA